MRTPRLCAHVAHINNHTSDHHGANKTSKATVDRRSYTASDKSAAEKHRREIHAGNNETAESTA